MNTRLDHIYFWALAFILTFLLGVDGMAEEVSSGEADSAPRAPVHISNDESPSDAGVDDVEVEEIPEADDVNNTVNDSLSAPLDLTPDPALGRLNAELSALAKGTPPKSNDIDSLFSIPLEDPKSLLKHAKTLPSEILKLEERSVQLQQQLSNPEILIPALEPPQILTSKPVEPVIPVSPTKPAKPTRIEIRAFLKQKKADLESDPRAIYRKALAQYELDARIYTDKKKEYEDRFTLFEKELIVYQSAKENHEKAVAKRNRAIEEQVVGLKTELHNIQNRISIAKSRQTYLTSLASVLERLSEPGLEAFQALKSPRTALRKRAETIFQLTTSARELLDRIRVLFHRAQAGALVGFRVQQEEVSNNLAEEVQSLEQRIKKGRLLSDELLAIADEIETDSRSQRLQILVTAKSPNLTAIMDDSFETRLRDSRRASRTPTGFAVTDADLLNVRNRLSSMLSKPKSISTVADSEKALLELRSVGEQLDQILDVIQLGRDRYHQAYKREVVTIFSSLASAEVKNRAYSFSYSLLEDFVADVNLLRVDLSLWAEERLNRVTHVSESLQTNEGLVRIIRVSLGLVLIFSLVFMRRKIRRRMARVILRLANFSAFQRRAGLLVRLTVFILALLPIVLVAASGYALLFLIGIEYPEVKIVEIAFRWALFYLVGRQFVIGLTRHERSGRPPLFEISKVNFDLLRITYARLGLFLAVIAAADEWSREWMGTGSLNTMVRFVASGWLAIWVFWAMIAWRRSMATSCSRQATEGSILHRIATFSGAYRIGVVLTPILFFWLIFSSFYRALKKLMAEGNLLAYLRARALRRMSRKTQVADSIVPTLTLPRKYIEAFPLYPLHGEEGQVLLPRKPQLETVFSQIAHWRSTLQDGSLVLVGEKGIGKTTFLALLEREISDIRTTRHIFAKKLSSEQELLADLCRPLNIQVQNVDELASHFNEQEPQVVLLDEAHNVFLRTVDGFKAVNALVSLVDATSNKVFWVLVFNSFSWSFLKKVNRHVRAFRKVLKLPPWSQAELMELVAKRNEHSGLVVDFDEVLLDADASSTGGFELISSADGFFRLLWEASRGNPRVATYLWLNALTAISKDRIRVGLIREADSDFLAELGDEMLFALASMAQHENLSFSELGRALNIARDEALHAARYLLEYGLLEPKHTDKNRYTLTPRFHQQVLRTLRSHNLLYLEE